MLSATGFALAHEFPRLAHSLLPVEDPHAQLRVEPLDAAPRNASAPPPDLLLAMLTDTHFWLPSESRRQWAARSDAAPERDGLLVADSDVAAPALLGQIGRWAAEAPNTSAVHVVHGGDAVCGGGSFGISAAEYEASLRLLAEQERAALPPGVPVHHVPGNHDLDPHAGGLGRWRDAFLGPNATKASPPAPNYRALSAGSWRLLLLDSVDGIDADRDGHGHIGATQLAWLDSELKAAAAAHQQVALLMHQLLVEPVDEYGGGGAPEWLDRRGDLVDNAAEVLALIARHPHVRLSFHGHVHANTLTVRGPTAFVSLASAGEWPMQWREARLFGCEAELRTHQLAMPALLERSRLRDTRGGRNAAKLGDALDNAVRLRWC